jgi:hypothetical protein
MTLNELEIRVKKDLKIDRGELSYEAIRTPDIFNDYNKMIFHEKLALKDLERKWDILYLERWEYYRKKAPEEVYQKEPLLKKIMDSDVKIYLNADNELQNLRKQIDGKEEIIDFLKRTLDNIANRQWLLKAANDNNKYLQGEK